MMKRLFTYALFNGTFLICIYLGLATGSEGAMNIVLLISWLLIVLTPAYNSEEVKSIMREEGRTVPAFINGWLDFFIVGAIAYAGHLFTAGLLALHYVVIEEIWKELKIPAADADRKNK